MLLFVTHLSGERGQPHESVSRDGQISARVAGHLGELLGQLLETGPGLGSWHPALKHHLVGET